MKRSEPIEVALRQKKTKKRGRQKKSEKRRSASIGRETIKRQSQAIL